MTFIPMSNAGPDKKNLSSLAQPAKASICMLDQEQMWKKGAENSVKIHSFGKKHKIAVWLGLLHPNIVTCAFYVWTFASGWDTRS